VCLYVFKIFYEIGPRGSRVEYCAELLTMNIKRIVASHSPEGGAGASCFFCG